MPRTHYTAADLERISCKVKDAETIFTFRNEQLLNLFINEMQGQISDGMWENSRHTDWLWKNVLYRLGEETKVEVFNSWHIGKKSYPLCKELWDVVGYRLYGDQDETTAGYQTEKEVRAAWKELNTAIYNASAIKDDDPRVKERRDAYRAHQNLVNDLETRGREERKKACGGGDYCYGTYLDQENKKDYVSIDLKIWNGTYYFVIDQVFRAEAGHLEEALDEIRDIAKNAKTVKLLTRY